MKKKWKANDYYMGAMLLGVAALLCAAALWLLLRRRKG